MLKKITLITVLTLSVLVINSMEQSTDSELSNFTIESNNEQYTLTMDELNNIEQKNELLNESPLFNTSCLKNKKWIENEMEALGGKQIELRTEDGCYVNCVHFSNGNDKVVLIAAGFGGSFNEMIPLVEFFARDYDVLLVDYWGQSGTRADDQSKTKWNRNPADRKFAERFRREHLDIEAALKYLNDLNAQSKCSNDQENFSEKRYKQIIGVGNCYSTMVLAKVQADAEQNDLPKFDALIFDSCWLSMQSVAEQVAHDPYLSFDQIHGGAPALLRMIMNIPYLADGFINFAQLVFNMNFEDFSIIESISKIQCPILIIQGTKDKLVTPEQFSKIWNAIKAPKLLLRTPLEHSVNRYKAKELFKFMVDFFVAELEEGDNNSLGDRLHSYSENYNSLDFNLQHAEVLAENKSNAKQICLMAVFAAFIVFALNYFMDGANNTSINLKS